MWCETIPSFYMLKDPMIFQPLLQFQALPSWLLSCSTVTSGMFRESLATSVVFLGFSAKTKKLGAGLELETAQCCNMYVFVCIYIHAFMDSFVRSCMHAFTHLFIHFISFCFVSLYFFVFHYLIHVCTYLCIYLIYLCIHFLMYVQYSFIFCLFISTCRYLLSYLHTDQDAMHNGPAGDCQEGSFSISVFHNMFNAKKQEPTNVNHLHSSKPPNTKLYRPPLRREPKHGRKTWFLDVPVGDTRKLRCCLKAEYIPPNGHFSRETDDLTSNFGRPQFSNKSAARLQPRSVEPLRRSPSTKWTRQKPQEM